MRSIISTVGTSLLSNKARLSPSGGDDEAALVRFLASVDPAQASAETNVLDKLKVDRADRLIFLHTATPEGERCAGALKAHFEGKVAGVAVVKVAHLTYEHRSFKQRGIKQLVDELATAIRREQRCGRDVIINATGGFKAEIAYATLVGLLFKTPVVYVHERFNEVVKLPPVPIQWDFSLMALHGEFFDWLDEEARPSGEVRERARALPHELRLLVEERLVDGYGGLNAAGQALYEAFRSRREGCVAERVKLSTRAEEALEAMDESTRRAFRHLLTNLQTRELWQQQSDLIQRGNMRVYPRGGRSERILFFEQGDEVRVCELCRHSDGSYERLLERGVKRGSYTFP